MDINVTLNFKEIPAATLAMAGQRGWAATLGGYIWMIFATGDTFVAAYRDQKVYHRGISSNPMTVIETNLETFDLAAESCARMFMLKTAPSGENYKLIN